jgi:hypothetical protein
MADVTLAEFDDQVWLVAGENFIDELLANMMPPGTTIEFVSCASRAEVWALWAENSLEPVDGVDPWIIHPGIVRRIKGSVAEPRVQFAPWSAQLSEEAKDTIGNAANWLAANPAGRITLRQFLPASPPGGLADIQRVRAMLVIGALTGAGSDAGRLDQETIPTEEPAAMERLEFVFTDMAAIKPN